MAEDFSGKEFELSSPRETREVVAHTEKADDTALLPTGMDRR